MTEDGGSIIARLLGRAAFLRDRGEIKTPELLEAAARELAKVNDEKEQGTNA